MERAGQLALPFLQPAVAGLNVEVDDAVRIGEVELRDCSDERDWGGPIEHRQTMMGEGHRW